jgi:uncharacterized protein
MSDRPAYRPSTWYDSRLTLGASPIRGQGLFATAPIGAGEIIMIWGGDLYSRADLKAKKVPLDTSYSFIEEDLLLAAPGDGMDYFVNHACDPTVWMADEVTVVARRAIAPGEEITGDYAVWESTPAYIVAPCRRGTALCRGRFTGDDWRRPDLHARYRGHFLPYISRRIARLHGAGSHAFNQDRHGRPASFR